MAKKKESVKYLLTGRKIITVTQMSPMLLSEAGWSEPQAVLVLDDGSLVFSGSDAERNQAGTLFGDAGGQGFYVRVDPSVIALLRGRTIRNVRRMDAAEMAAQAWDRRAPLLLDVGVARLFPSSDDEGNSPGLLIVRRSNGSIVYAEEEGPQEWSPRSHA